MDQFFRHCEENYEVISGDNAPEIAMLNSVACNDDDDSNYCFILNTNLTV